MNGFGIANATNFIHLPINPIDSQKQFPTALLISRNSWTPQVVLAGHAGIVGATRYAPCLIRKDDHVLQLVAIGCDVGLSE